MATVLDTYPPSYGSSEETDYNTLELRFGDSYSQRTTDGINSEEDTKNLIWTDLALTEWQEIKEFFDGLAGVEPFEYALPGDAETKKWIAKKPRAVRKTYNTVDAQVTIIRVYDL